MIQQAHKLEIILEEHIENLQELRLIVKYQTYLSNELHNKVMQSFGQMVDAMFDYDKAQQAEHATDD